MITGQLEYQLRIVEEDDNLEHPIDIEADDAPTDAPTDTGTDDAFLEETDIELLPVNSDDDDLDDFELIDDEESFEAADKSVDPNAELDISELNDDEAELGLNRPASMQVIRDVNQGVPVREFLRATFSKEHRYRRLAAIGLLVFALLATYQLSRPSSAVTSAGAETSPPGETHTGLSDITNLANGVQVRAAETGITPQQVGQAEQAGNVPPSSADYDVQGVRYHRVQPGDNLFRIGLAYGLRAEVIAAANGIADPNMIIVGQVLSIPVQAATSTEVQQPAARSSMTSQVETGRMPAVSPQELGTIREVNGVRMYCVNQGDTLWGLSQQFGTTVDRLAGANGIDRNVPGSLKMATWIIIPPQG